MAVSSHCVRLEKPCYRCLSLIKDPSSLPFLFFTYVSLSSSSFFLCCCLLGYGDVACQLGKHLQVGSSFGLPVVEIRKAKQRENGME